MKTIYKYTIDYVSDVVTIEMPSGAKVRKVGEQGGLITLWAEVDTLAPIVPVRFNIYGTGNPIDENDLGTYLDSVFVDPFVWHVYEQERTWN